MKRHIRLAFVDMSPMSDPAVKYFLDLLAPHYDIELSGTLDFIFYSRFGKGYQRYDCPRICYIGEARRPNFRDCDYAISFDFPHPGWGVYAPGVLVGPASDRKRVGGGPLSPHHEGKARERAVDVVAERVIEQYFRTGGIRAKLSKEEMPCGDVTVCPVP